MTDDVRQDVSRYFRSVGYSYMALDLDGFRSGSLNEVLETRLKTPLSGEGFSS